MADLRVPVTVLTGFLGAGKTTLLNRILREKHGLRLAVVENEFGSVGIDQDLVVGAQDGLFELNNGCVCCTVKDDLVRILGQLLLRREKFDGILIETTGLADPSPVVKTFLEPGPVAQGARLDAVVAVVDAYHLPRRLDESREAVEQIAFADRILLNKVDLVDDAALAAVEARVRAVNPWAKLLRTRRCDAPLAEILGVGAFDLARVEARMGRAAESHGHEHDHAHGHDHGAISRHDAEVAAVGIEEPGALDLDRLDAWLRDLLARRGDDVFRTKGVLHVAGSDRPVVFQGVHALLEATEGAPWGARPRVNRLTFIGRRLDRDELLRGFRGCLK